MNLINYVGRTVDVAAFQGVAGGRAVLLRQSLADEGRGGTAVTGIVKLGQRFLIELLTERGSLLYFPDRGSTFMTEARLGYIRTSADLFAAFTRALLDVQRTLRAEDATTDSDDEKFGTAEIDSAEFAAGAAKISVRITSKAAKAEIILPVSLYL